jgi:predicted ArsR family transcriptional regulator
VIPFPSDNIGYDTLSVEAILTLLARHGSLAAEQVAAQLGDPRETVNNALRRFRDRGLVDVLAVGELEGHSTNAASYWRLTDEGRSHLARLG